MSLGTMTMLFAELTIHKDGTVYGCTPYVWNLVHIEKDKAGPNWFVLAFNQQHMRTGSVVTKGHIRVFRCSRLGANRFRVEEEVISVPARGRSTAAENYLTSQEVQ